MHVRPFQPLDQSDVNALHRAVWWPERSHAGWDWLDVNPARADIDAPSGWVVEDKDGRPAAFLGNLVQRFWYGEARHNGVTGFSIIVPPAARGRSRQLIQTFLRQPGVFASYTFNANAKSAPLYARHGMVPWPPRTHGLKLSWVVDPVACLHGRLLRTAVKRAPTLSDPYRERFLNRRLNGPAESLLPRGVTPLTDLGDGSDYGLFWERLKREGRLVADRSPAILRWRLADPDRTLEPVLLAYRRGDAITGYAMAVLAKANPIEPAFLEILDLVALQDEPHAIPALMRALLVQARDRGAAKLRLQTLDEEMLRRLGDHADRARHEGGWGHCHALFASDGPPRETWSPTPFDGDYGVCQRPVPVSPTMYDRNTASVLGIETDARPVA